MHFKPAASRIRPCEHRFFSVPPAILLSLILGAAILPFLLFRSLQRVRHASWEHMLWGISAWIWITASIVAMGLLMATGWVWRRVAATVRDRLRLRKRMARSYRATPALPAPLPR